MDQTERQKFPEASEARRAAGFRLSVNGNRLLLVLGLLTVLPSVMLYILLESTIVYVTSIGDTVATDHTQYLLGEGIYIVAALLLTIFFVLPLLYGLLARLAPRLTWCKRCAIQKISRKKVLGTERKAKHNLKCNQKCHRKCESKGVPRPTICELPC